MGLWTELLLVGGTGLAGILLAWFLFKLFSVAKSMATSPHVVVEEKDGRPTTTSARERERGEGDTTFVEGSFVMVGPAGLPKRTHPLYKRIALLSGKVNAMSLADVKAALLKRGLAKSGVDQVLYRRLKVSLRREAILADPTAPTDLIISTETNPYRLDYLCVLDFEATCLERNPPDYVHEVIEFPVLLLNLKTLKIDDTFHHFCRPLLNPTLSDFCKRLTGIRQDQVEGACSFSEVFRQFTEWLEDKGLGTTHKFALVTDCPWDIKECLFPQCVLARIPFPNYATKWIDVRKLYASFYQMKSGNLAKMLECLGMRFQGREHSGIDDSKNITEVLLRLIQDGCVLKYNRFMPQDVLADFAQRRK